MDLAKTLTEEDGRLPWLGCLPGSIDRRDLFIKHHTGPLRNDHPAGRRVSVLGSDLSPSDARLHQNAMGFPQGFARDRFRRGHPTHFLLRSAVKTKLGIRPDPQFPSASRGDFWCRFAFVALDTSLRGGGGDGRSLHFSKSARLSTRRRFADLPAIHLGFDTRRPDSPKRGEATPDYRDGYAFARPRGPVLSRIETSLDRGSESPACLSHARLRS